MDERCKVVAKLMDKIVTDGAVSAMAFISDKEVIRATRRRYRMYKAGIRKDSQVSVVVSIGKPNYLDRAFIKSIKKSGTKFPSIKDIKVKWAKPDTTKRKEKAS